MSMKNPLTPAGIEPATFRFVEQHLNGLYPTKYYSGDQRTKNEMGCACGTRGRQERCVQDFGG